MGLEDQAEDAEDASSRASSKHHSKTLWADFIFKGLAKLIRSL